MIPDFNILNIENTYIILLNTNKRLPELLDSIEDSIIERNITGNILIDLVVSNGLSNRFVEIPVVAGSLCKFKMKAVGIINDNILRIINKYYKNNKQYIIKSHISRVEKHKVLEQIEMM